MEEKLILYKVSFSDPTENFEFVYTMEELARKNEFVHTLCSSSLFIRATLEYEEATVVYEKLTREIYNG